MESEEALGKENKLDEILEQFEQCEDFWKVPYERGEADVDFALGKTQWPEKIRKLREDDDRPCLVENRMLPFVNQVINSIRQSRPSIVPKPVDDKADVECADILRGLIRNIEVVSDADSVYDTAARNSVMASVGWIRVVTDYCGHDTFDQEARIERIENFKSVMLDPNHRRQDGSDAEYGFVVDEMDDEAFEAAYPKAVKQGIDRTGWKGTNTIRVVEYFYKDYTDAKLVEYIGPLGKASAIEGKVPFGAKLTGRSRDTKICTIKYCKVTALEILEEAEFPGEYIPLVPVYGFETYTDNRRDFYSLINPAKDPQRMLNFWKSAATEIFALQPKTPWVGAKGQFASYSQQWTDANRINLPYLEYDVVLDENNVQAPPPQRAVPPTPPPGMLQEAMACADAIKATVGLHDAYMGQQTNDISGKAIISRQMQGDNATFHFIDNLSVAIRHVGRILICIIPLVYSGDRIVRILGEDGAESLVPLGRPVVKDGKGFRVATPQDDNQVAKVIKLDAGKYDVVVEVGPSYGTKRQELANAIVEIAKVKPEIMNIAGDLFVKALDIPNNEEIAKRIRATMDPALLGDDVEAQRLQQLTQALNDVQSKLQLTEEALLAKKNNQEFENSLEMKKVENDTEKLKIDMVLAQAQLMKIKAETGVVANEDILTISAAIRDLKAQADDVAQAMHVLLSAKEEEGTGAPEAPETTESLDLGQPSGSGG